MQQDPSLLESTPRKKRDAVHRNLAAMWASKPDMALWAALIVIIWLYLLLIFTDSIPVFGFVLLGGLWLVYWVFSGRLTYATPLDVPVLIIIGLLPLNMAISVDWAVSLPKIYGILLGIAIFYWIVNFVRNYERLGLAILGLVLLGLGMALIGLMGMDWSTSQITLLSPIYERLPSLLTVIPRQVVGSGIHVNTVGGALAFLIPLLASLAWDRGAVKRVYLGHKTGWLHFAYKALVILALLLGLFALLLTFSRGAYVGTVVGLFVLAVWKDRRFLWLLPILLILGVIFFLFGTNGNLTYLISLLDAGNESTLVGRSTYWRNTLAMIQDFPFTGAGLATYSQVFEDLYFYNIFPYQGMSYLHAHNTYFAIAIDLGLPALVSYAAMLTVFAGITMRRNKIVRSVAKELKSGLACGLLAHHIFGLTDAFELGTKLGVILWIFLGVGAAVYIHKDGFRWDNTYKNEIFTQKPDGATIRRRLVEIPIGLGAWLLISLAAVSFVNLSPLVSVGAAVVGGMFLGIFLLERFRQTNG